MLNFEKYLNWGFDKNITKEDWSFIEPLILKYNVKTVKIFSSAALVIMFILTILALREPELYPSWLIYGLYGIGVAVVRFSISRIDKTSLVWLLTRFSLIIALIFSVLLETVFYSRYPSVTICVMMVFAPLTIIDRIPLLILEILGSGALAVVLSRIYKEPAVFHEDFFNITIFFIIGCYNLITVQRIRLTNLLYETIRSRDIKKKLQQDLEQSKLKLMLGQMKPHFIFNVLNGISSLCLHDPEKANQSILNLSKYLRNNLDSMGEKQLHPFSEEVDHIAYFMRLEQMRFGRKTQYLFDFEIESFLVPTLSVEPLVENAVIHGLGPKGREGSVIIKTYEEGNNICILVEDDGIGFDAQGLDKAEDKRGIGLRNVISRWKYLQNACIDITSEPGKGVRVIVKISKEKALISEELEKP